MLVGSVNVPAIGVVIVAIVGAVSVLLVSVSVVARPTSWSVASGSVNVLLLVCDVANVVAVAVVPAALNINLIVLSALSTIDVLLSTKLPDIVCHVAVVADVAISA